MKPFDLQAAMRGEPIVTRDGRAAKFIGYDEFASEEERVVVRIIGGPRNGYHESGVFYTYMETPADLFMATNQFTREFWVNVYPDPNVIHSFPSRDLSDMHAGPARIACLKVILNSKEGEGLEGLQ